MKFVIYLYDKYTSAITHVHTLHKHTLTHCAHIAQIYIHVHMHLHIQADVYVHFSSRPPLKKKYWKF